MQPSALYSLLSLRQPCDSSSGTQDTISIVTTLEFGTTITITKKSPALPDDTRQSHISSAAKTHIIEGSHGYAFGVDKSEHSRSIDLHGEQITGLAARVQGTNFVEKSSMP